VPLDLAVERRTVAKSGGARICAPRREEGPPDPTVSGFSTTVSKSMSIVRRARMVSSGDDGVYTGSSLRGVIPYVQCVTIGFPSQVCSQSGLQASREREFVPKSRVVVYDPVKV
jgi:hypothetical protein